MDLVEIPRRVACLFSKDVNNFCSAEYLIDVLLTFLWLRKYPCIDTLALFFDVSRSIIRSAVPFLWRFFSGQVACPFIAEWDLMRGILFVF